MIILFAPAKSMNEKISYNSSNHIFDNKTQILVNTILSWNKLEFLNAFNINESLYNKVFSYYNNFYSNKSYVSFELFSGEAYKSLNYETLTKKEIIYLNSKVIVIDALYGIIYPNSYIKPYRLDFHTKNLKLTSFWKKDINDFFSKLDDKEILSLSSKEFSSLLTKDKNVIDVKFTDEINGVKKSISVFNKQMRGTLLRYIIVNEINSIKDLPNQIEGYVKEKEIINNVITYIKRTNRS